MAVFSTVKVEIEDEEYTVLGKDFAGILKNWTLFKKGPETLPELTML